MLAGGGAQGQSIQYASCVKGWIVLPAVNNKSGRVAAPICYCLISELPFIPFFRDVLIRLLGMVDRIASDAVCLCA